MGLPGHLPYATNAPYYRNGENEMYIPSDLVLLEEDKLNNILNFERDYDVD
jgi:2-phospho-L-lactate guanylyltransferase (CobY/MobA/RfbA family)